MPDYVFTSRDGDVYDIYSPEELTPEQIKDIDLELNPARASDYFRGSVSALSEFGYNVLETAHEVGNFIGGEINKVAFGESGKDIENPWDDFKEKGRDVYEGNVPEHVKDRLSYKVIKGVSQLAGMAASGPAAPFTMASQGFAAGREDYLNSMGVSDSEATQDQLEAARGVGAMVAIPTVVLEKIGLGRIGRGISTKLADKVAAPATKRVAGMMATEGATEGLEQVASNIIASDIAGYDPSRSVGTGVGESALIGSLVGGVPGGIKYSPSIAIEGAKGLKKVADVGVDRGIALAQTKAAKSVVDLAANGAIHTVDITNELSQKMLGAVVERGIDLEPIARGGQLVANKVTDSLKNREQTFQKIVDGLKKGADLYAKSEPARWIDDAIRPLNDRVKAINERLGQELTSFEHEHMKRYYDFYKMAEAPITTMQAIKKGNRKQFKEFHKAILRKDWETAKAIYDQYDKSQSWEQIGTTLRKIYEESAQRGSDIGHIEEYFPRFVKDYPKLAERLGTPIPKTQWEKIKNDAEKRKGEDLTQEEEAALFEDTIRAKRSTGVEKGKSNFTKQRKIDEVDDDIADLYADPIEALGLYMNQMSDSITRMDYLGAMYDVVQAGTEDAVYTPEEIKEASNPQNAFRLSKDLIKGKPAYRQTKEIIFTNDFERAVYSATVKSNNGKRLKYRNALKRQGYSDSQIDEAGLVIRQQLKNQYDTQNPPKSMRTNIGRVDPADGTQYEPGSTTYMPEEIEGVEGGGPKRTRRLGAFGRAIQEEVESGRLDDAQVDEIHRMLGARFQKKQPMHKFVRGAKTLTHLAFLGSPTTAITQLGDYAYSFYKNGINETLKAFKKPEWTLEDVYQIGNDIAWEFTDSQSIPDKMQKTLDTVLSLTGMRAMDTKAKGTFLTGTSNRWKKILNGRDSKAKSELIQRIQKNQGLGKAGQTIKDIKAGRKSDGVAEMLLYELGEIAPMTQSDMPQLYNQYPNVRILYALKSYTIKQFNFARNQSAKKIVSGDPKQVKEGMLNMLKLSAALALANIPADIIKDFITGDDMRLDIDDVLIDNLWRLLGLNSYTQVIVKREGVGSAIENLTYKPPLVSLVDDVGKDILNFAPPIISDESKSLQYIPVIGKLIYKWQKNYGQ